MTQASGFGKFIPGFDFLQSLSKQAMDGMTGGQAPLSSWVAPTFSVEELDKRISDLKAVQFWLDQNAKALSATIQALEVQKMTLATLETMNVKLGDVAEAMKFKPADAASQAGEPSGKTPFAGFEAPAAGPAAAKPARGKGASRRKTATSAKDDGASPGATTAGMVDPMQWWGALSQQFQHIASQAMQDAAQSVSAADPAGDAAPARGRNARTGRAAASATRKPRTATRRREA